MVLQRIQEVGYTLRNLAIVQHPCHQQWDQCDCFDRCYEGVGFVSFGRQIFMGRQQICDIRGPTWVKQNTVSKKTGSGRGDFFLGGRLHLREQS